MGSIRASVTGAALPLVGAPLLAGCFVVADFDRFHGPGGASPTNGGVNGYSAPVADGLVVSVDERVGTHLEVKLSSDSSVVACAIFDGFSRDDAPFTVPGLIPRDGKGYRLYVQGTTGTGSLIDFGHVLLGLLPHDDGPYRLELASVAFESRTARPVPAAGVPATIQIRSLPSRKRRLVEARVLDGTSDDARLVGLYRFFQPADTDAAALKLPGCVKANTTHRVSLYVDANGNGAYDDPTTHAGDLGVVANIPATEDGLETTFDLTNTTIGTSAVPSPFSP